MINTRLLSMCISFCCAIISCKEGTIETTNRFEIYCWDFNLSKNSSQPRSWASVHPYTTPIDVIRNNNLFFLDSNIATINSLQELVHRTRSESKTNSINIDTRFVMLFRYGSVKVDTLVYVDNKSLLLNGTTKLQYDFPIIDSIKVLIKKDSISCSTSYAEKSF